MVNTQNAFHSTFLFPGPSHEWWCIEVAVAVAFCQGDLDCQCCTYITCIIQYDSRQGLGNDGTYGHFKRVLHPAPAEGRRWRRWQLHWILLALIYMREPRNAMCWTTRKSLSVVLYVCPNSHTLVCDLIIRALHYKSYIFQPSSSSFCHGTIFSDPLLSRRRGDLAYPIPHALFAMLSP